MATLGKTSVGGSAQGGWAAYCVIGQPFVATENGTINSVKMAIDGTGIDTNGKFCGVVYEGTSTRTLVATGAEVTVAHSAAEAILVSTVSSGSIISGHTYRFGYIVAPHPNGDANQYYDAGSSGDSFYSNAFTYPTAPADMSSATAYTNIITAWIDYTATVAAPTNSVAPAVTGTAKVGSTLTTDDGTWTGSPTFTYQWQRGGVNIAGQTANTHALVDADDALNVRCVVTGTNGSGSASANSNAVAITEPVPTNSVAPVASGSVSVGSTVSVTTGTWTHQGGTVATYAYQWQDSADGSSGWADIGGATANSLTVLVGELTKYFRCNVTATNSGGASASATASNVLGPVTAAVTGARNRMLMGVG